MRNLPDRKSRRLRLDDLAAGDARVDRRAFLLGGAAGSAGIVLPGTSSAEEQKESLFSCCTGSDPLGCIRRTKFDVLVAFVEAQLYALWRCPPAESATEVAADVLRYAGFLKPDFQKGICGALTYINLYSLRKARKAFVRLSPCERTELLNQGEYPLPSDYPLISWDCEYILHTAVGGLAMLCRLVTNARKPARMLIGLTWSAPCRDPSRLVTMLPPPYPDLHAPYDLCVIGSGAGGSVVAARAALAGQRVLIVEAGKWISPDSLVERYHNEQGEVEIFPPRGDRVLSELYRDGGANLAGGLRNVIDSRWDLILPWRRSRIEPQQTISVLQAQVVGGGPYVNNAIFLEMREDAWQRWGERRPAGISYEELRLRMDEVKRDLGVNREATRRDVGARSWKFVDGCIRAGEHVEPLPVAILPDCGECGADNSMDPFGGHTGGLHPWRTGGPNSYLMRALQAPAPAQVAYETAAISFEFSTTPDGAVVAPRVVLEDRRGL
ncbi:MAG: GMC family oxidoreductase N-terminal domain-containing protein, partial [Planctomycetes bacterium]|nr:GMC family oxidoreductase N-terminal domain-containing protein [Planctomycetota bacterium]